MKRTRFILLGLLLAAWPLAGAVASEAPKLWVSPQAQAIRERVNTALAAIEGWTATITSESVIVENGVARSRSEQVTERFLRSSGPVAYYAAIRGTAQDPVASVKYQDLAVERFVVRNAKGLHGQLSPANELNRPDFWLMFDHVFNGPGYVHWAGQETFAGQACDVIEAISFDRMASGDPTAEVTGVNTTRFYVNAAGLIEGIRFSTDRKSGAQGFYFEQRISYDTKAKLAPEDFLPAGFERDAAAVVLQGRPMPPLQERVFAAGGTLPDFTFTGWPDGKPFRLSDLKGSIVVVETWATWCHFCKAAFPTYEKARQALADQGVVFVALSFDERPADYEKWMKQHGGDYGFKFGRVETDDPKKAMKEFRGSLPGFYVLDRDGRIVSSYLGWSLGSGEEDPRLLAALRAAGIKI